MSSSSYDNLGDFGALYDAVPVYARRPDVGFYVEEASRTGDARRVLELGCGTGRVLLPLARAGHSVTGIDASAAMLARCRAKLAAEPAEVRGRVALLESDIRDFQVPTRETLRHPAFAIAIAPFRVFQHLLTPMDQLRCLASVRAHLEPGGRLLFDVFNPHFAAMTRDRSAEVEDTPEFALGDGRYLRRASRVPRVHWAEQLSDVELIYYVRSGSDVERVVHAFPMRWYGAPELQHLLARSGYRVEGIYGDFDGGALRDDSPEIVVAAVRDD